MNAAAAEALVAALGLVLSVTLSAVVTAVRGRELRALAERVARLEGMAAAKRPPAA
jgi:hypothetical protein